MTPTSPGTSSSAGTTTSWSRPTATPSTGCCRLRSRVSVGSCPSLARWRRTDEAMLERARATFETVGEQIEAVRLRDGLLSVMALASALNRYLDEAAPWKTLKTDPERAATSLWTALQVVSALRVLTAPYLPFSAQQLHEYLGDEGDVHALPWAFRDLPAGRALPPPQPLFRKLDDEELAGLVGRLDEPWNGDRVGESLRGRARLRMANWQVGKHGTRHGLAAEHDGDEFGREVTCRIRMVRGAAVSARGHHDSRAASSRGREELPDRRQPRRRGAGYGYGRRGLRRSRCLALLAASPRPADARGLGPHRRQFSFRRRPGPSVRGRRSFAPGIRQTATWRSSRPSRSIPAGFRAISIPAPGFPVARRPAGSSMATASISASACWRSFIPRVTRRVVSPFSIGRRERSSSAIFSIWDAMLLFFPGSDPAAFRESLRLAAEIVAGRRHDLPGARFRAAGAR